MHWNSSCGRNRAVWSTSTQGGVKNEDQVASHRLAPWRCSKIVKYHPFARPWTNTLASGHSSIGFTDHHWIHTAVYQIIFAAQTFWGMIDGFLAILLPVRLGGHLSGIVCQICKGGMCLLQFCKAISFILSRPDMVIAPWVTSIRDNFTVISFTNISFNVLGVQRRTNIKTYVYS